MVQFYTKTSLKYVRIYYVIFKNRITKAKQGLIVKTLKIIIYLTLKMFFGSPGRRAKGVWLGGQTRNQLILRSASRISHFLNIVLSLLVELSIQDEFLQAQFWFLHSHGYPSSQPLNLLLFEPRDLEYMWSELCAEFNEALYSPACSLVSLVEAPQLLSLHLPFSRSHKINCSSSSPEWQFTQGLSPLFFLSH